MVAAACTRVTSTAGTVLVKVSANSTTTTKGRAAEPSGVDCSPLAGSAPTAVISACARRAPLSAGSRYLATKSAARQRLLLRLSSEPPNSTVSSTGPTSKVARAVEVRAPCTWMRAPTLIEMVISPKSRCRW